ncbi:hypothetical protein GCM10009114_09680 [Aliiglaciecola litoralis]|uniref:Uncharacterized protein n=1 Tax=Aliiglaciecola litoralis TaxID=582857 RepID=A0ABN1LEY8_9ALTE
MILVALYFGYSNIQHQHRMSLIEQPQIHDFYFVDYHLLAPTTDAKFRYLPLKVKSIDGDNVVFKIGNIGHTEKVSANNHVKSDAAMHRNYFRKEELILPVSQLHSLAEQGVIYDIARPNNIFIEGWMVMHLSELNTENSGS